MVNKYKGFNPVNLSLIVGGLMGISGYFGWVGLACSLVLAAGWIYMTSRSYSTWVTTDANRTIGGEIFDHNHPDIIPGSLFRNCTFEHRPGDPAMFTELRSGGFFVYLDGYMIRPNENCPR